MGLKINKKKRSYCNKEVQVIRDKFYHHAIVLLPSSVPCVFVFLITLIYWYNPTETSFWLRSPFNNSLIGLLTIILFELLTIIIGSLYDMYIESSLRGYYISKVRKTLRYGFYAFVISEGILFFSFFWAHLDLRLVFTVLFNLEGRISVILGSQILNRFKWYCSHPIKIIKTFILKLDKKKIKYCMLELKKKSLQTSVNRRTRWIKKKRRCCNKEVKVIQDKLYYQVILLLPLPLPPFLLKLCIIITFIFLLIKLLYILYYFGYFFSRVIHLIKNYDNYLYNLGVLVYNSKLFAPIRSFCTNQLQVIKIRVIDYKGKVKIIREKLKPQIITWLPIILGYLGSITFFLFLVLVLTITPWVYIIYNFIGFLLRRAVKYLTKNLDQYWAILLPWVYSVYNSRWFALVSLFTDQLRIIKIRLAGLDKQIHVIQKNLEFQVKARERTIVKYSRVITLIIIVGLLINFATGITLPFAAKWSWLFLCCLKLWLDYFITVYPLETFLVGLFLYVVFRPRQGR